jgi:AAA+ ATPase superfamily predicted ATPase
MPKFVDRETELADLSRLAARPGGQFVIVYGRRRVGKTSCRFCLTG